MIFKLISQPRHLLSSPNSYTGQTCLFGLLIGIFTWTHLKEDHRSMLALEVGISSLLWVSHLSKCINFYPVSQARNLKVSPGSLLCWVLSLPSNLLVNAVGSKSSTFHCLHCNCPNWGCHNPTSEMFLWACNWPSHFHFFVCLFFSFKLN